MNPSDDQCVYQLKEKCMEQPGGESKKEGTEVASSKGKGNKYLLNAYYKIPNSFLGISTCSIVSAS